MAPIHDTDIAAERWSQAEWENYELWEKIEVRLRRRKYLWIAAAIALFLTFSALPILADRWPKWEALKASRKLAQLVNYAKKEAGLNQHAYRIIFKSGTLEYAVQKVTSCTALDAVVVEEGNLLETSIADGFRILNFGDSSRLRLPGLIDSICYDPLAGMENFANDDSMKAFAIAPIHDVAVNSLTEARMDRIAILFMKGPSAELTFE